MFRIFSRIAAIALVLSLSLLAVSPAQAAPLGGTRWISKMPVRWADTALSLVSSLFTPAPAQQTMEKGNGNGSTSGGTGGSGGGWTATPQTGSCIDPQGNPCTVDPDPEP